MTTYIALLRGINVGRGNRVKMADLKAMLAELGLENPQTLLQSGNVVFKSPAEGEELEAQLQKATKERFGFGPLYFLRTVDEWEEIVAGNPFQAMAQDDPSHLVVVFVNESPDPVKTKEISESIQGREEIRAGSRHFYITYPDSIGHSKLDKTPGLAELIGLGTARNWNTVTKLLTLAKTA